MFANPQGGKERPPAGGKEETATTKGPTAVNGDNATRGGGGELSGGNIAGGAPRTLWTGDANSLDSADQGDKILARKEELKHCELCLLFLSLPTGRSLKLGAFERNTKKLTRN
jgi:hypothetical protein